MITYDCKKLIAQMSKKPGSKEHVQEGIEVSPYAVFDHNTDAHHCLDPADPD